MFYVTYEVEWILRSVTDVARIRSYSDSAMQIGPVTWTIADRHPGYCFFMNELSGAVSWACRKQQTVSLSTAEAEYMAASAASQEVLFLEKLSREITGRCGKIVILEDNQACIAMAKKPLFHRRTKHVDIRHHFIRELVQKGVIQLTYCPTEDMAADLLTKDLGRLKTVKFRAILLGYIDNSKNI